MRFLAPGIGGLRAAALSAACTAVLLAAATADAVHRAWTASPPTLEAAAEAMRDGDADRAARILTELSAQTPGDARVWRALGRAELQRKRAREAIVAYRRALALEPDAPH